VGTDSGVRVLLTDEINVKLSDQYSLKDISNILELNGVEISRTLMSSENIYALRLMDPAHQDPLRVANALFETNVFAWSEPNLVQDYQTLSIPNDPLFYRQWHLHNTGQAGGKVDVDVDAPEAWDIEMGKSSTIIAVLDDGVEWFHEDLLYSIFYNFNDPPNGRDDDLNGMVDDVSGWDFFNNVGTSIPKAAKDNHGTHVAGVAAATGNNGKGVTGVCPYCKILPVKISQNGQFQSDAVIYAAIIYASQFAAIINNSWGGGLPTNTIAAAIKYVTTNGRQGKGTLVFCASGNFFEGNDERERGN
jgi:subtilisin family serine protease